MKINNQSKDRNYLLYLPETDEISIYIFFYRQRVETLSRLNINKMNIMIRIKSLSLGLPMTEIMYVIPLQSRRIE